MEVRSVPEALESFLRTRASTTLIKTDDVATRMVLRWREELPEGRARRLLRPGEAAYDLVGSPGSLWWLYSPLHLARAAVHQLLRQEDAELGAFLGTPTSLIPALLAFATVTEGDLVVDVGCGDGRIVIEAAQSTRCDALGIERDLTLAEPARERADPSYSWRDRESQLRICGASKPDETESRRLDHRARARATEVMHGDRAGDAGNEVAAHDDRSSESSSLRARIV